MARILVVDDDPACRTLLLLGLQDDGHELAGAADGASAIRIATSFRPDLLVVDQVLKDTMTGLGVARTLRNLLDDPAIVLVARFPSHAVDIGSVRAIVVEKPMDAVELLDRVREAVGELLP